jgi:hypothetical protein
MKYAAGVIGVVLVAIIAIIMLVRRTPEPRTDIPQETVLSDYANRDGRVRYTIDGRINAREDHRTIVITVSRTERMLEIYQGYENDVLRRETFVNSEGAYSTFLRALESAGFSQERETDIHNYTGICPQGRRHVYELLDGPEEIMRTWDTSCSRRLGSFDGNSSLVRQLFQRQIPDYSRLTSGVRL